MVYLARVFDIVRLLGQEVVLLPILRAMHILAFYRNNTFLNFLPSGYK